MDDLVKRHPQGTLEHMTLGSSLFAIFCALVAWTLIEVFINHAHRLSRGWFIVWHYIVVIASFGLLFALYVRLVDTPGSPFQTTAVAMTGALVLDWIVFRFLYSGERWFLNWVDWIVPVFIATSTIYAVLALW